MIKASEVKTATTKQLVERVYEELENAVVNEIIKDADNGYKCTFINDFEYFLRENTSYDNVAISYPANRFLCDKLVSQLKENGYRVKEGYHGASLTIEWEKEEKIKEKDNESIRII